MIEDRISKQQLQKLYSVDRSTIESWVKNHGLPMIIINSHSKYVKANDLCAWEGKLMKNRITEDDEVE
ncbi:MULTISPECIES: hypothetical protein [Arenibacter]|uniref:hypothetical protein n=1 Tax=Arenibacter TaxID=178469 RepID=UPI0012FFF44A|nr:MULTISPECIES: hypothetical protein [Arenibacter]